MWMRLDSLVDYASSTFNMNTKHWPNTGQPLGEHNLLSWYGAMKSPGIITMPLLSQASSINVQFVRSCVTR